MLDWKFFPHIFDNIYDYLDGQGLEAMRLTCSSLRARAETDLWEQVILSHRVLHVSSPGSATRPEAVILTQTQLYSSLYDSPLPHAYANGHKVTEVVNITHPPTTFCLYRCERCVEECEHDDAECPLACHLTAVINTMGFEVVFQLLDADTHNCHDLDSALDRLGCEALIVSQRLRTSDEQNKANHLYRYPINQHIFKLSYASKGGYETQPVVTNSYTPFPVNDFTIVLHPREENHTEGVRPRAATNEVESFDLSSFLGSLAEEGRLRAPIFVVATDTWPPEGPLELRRPTPQISEPAFQAALETCTRRGEGQVDRIQVITWPDARLKFGNKVCDLLMSEPSPLRLSQDNGPPWGFVSAPVAPLLTSSSCDVDQSAPAQLALRTYPPGPPLL